MLGKTVWYDLNPDVEGFAEVEATGFDTVVAVYEYSRSTGRLLRGQCFDDAAGVSESALVRLRAGGAYTAQVGGVDAGAGPASGALTVRIRFLADRDGDGRIDRLDECPALAGVRSEGFCPPKVAVSPLYAFQALPGRRPPARPLRRPRAGPRGARGSSSPAAAAAPSGSAGPPAAGAPRGSCPARGSASRRARGSSCGPRPAGTSASTGATRSATGGSRGSWSAACRPARGARGSPAPER